MKPPQLLDAYGRPIERKSLTLPVAAATVGGVRRPLTGYPADGLDPRRLATILRQADQGDPIRYFELAETIEERDPHYLGVLGTRRRSVSQIEITVEAASDAAEDVARADRVREWLKRDELQEELFDVLDAIGKGVSFTEILWDTSTGQWEPARLEWRDQRWFRWDRTSLSTPLLVDDDGQEKPLPGGKFITANLKAKSGLPLRSGLARVAAWGWMFKAYTQRDWAIFTQTYGQPLRLGRYPNGATEEDKETLFRAVANIAGDCAAIVPAGMDIEFVESGSVGAASELYLERANWLDQQISKAVLGQTATTDAVTGGLGSGKEHREVQQDIERADCRALAANLNRDLIRPWMQLEFGVLKAYPRLKIDRPESDVRDRFGLPEPDDDQELMGPQGAETEPDQGAGGAAGRPPQQGSKTKGKRDESKGGQSSRDTETARQAEAAPRASFEPSEVADLLTDRMAVEAAPAVEGMLERVELMMQAAGSLPELGEMIRAGFDGVDETELARVLAQSFLAANLAGRAAVLEEE